MALLLRPSLGTVRVSLDLSHLLRIRHADPWWIGRCNHQDVPQGGSLVIGRDADPGLLELADIWRRGGPRGA
jgi:hypothetical protein